MLSMIALLLGGLVCSYILTGLMRQYALSRNLLDVPNERSSHAKVMPRGGGLAIVITFSLGLSLFWVTEAISQAVLLALMGGGVLVAAIGFWDDHGHVSKKARMIVHILAAAWATYGIMLSAGLNPVVMPDGLLMLASIFILTWLVNLFNFMDGIDGLAGSEAVFIALSGGLLVWLAGSDVQALMFVLLAVSVLGFLIWNWPPARIFMGDVGSGFLGLVLGVLACSAIMLGLVDFWPWLILFGVFLVDATITLIRRMLRGERWYEAHCSHAYQHAARRWGHRKVTMFLNVINYLCLLPLALLTFYYPEWGWWIAMLAILSLAFLALLFKAGLPQ